MGSSDDENTALHHRPHAPARARPSAEGAKQRPRPDGGLLGNMMEGRLKHGFKILTPEKLRPQYTPPHPQLSN